MSNVGGATAPMPRYRSHKQVWALKITSVNGHELTFAEDGYGPITVDALMFTRYTPVPGDYYVVYGDGYASISPAKAFEEGYTKRDGAPEGKSLTPEAVSLAIEQEIFAHFAGDSDGLSLPQHEVADISAGIVRRLFPPSEI